MPVSAPEARNIGLVDEVLPSDRFEAELSRRVEVILQASSFTVRKTKEMLQSLGHGRAPLEKDESLAWFVEATRGADFKEGVEAFLSKRPPRLRYAG